MNLRSIYLLTLLLIFGFKVSFRPRTEPSGFNIEPNTNHLY